MEHPLKRFIKNNRWKLSFFVLLAICLLVVIGTLFMLFMISEKMPYEEGPGVIERETATLTVVASKNDLNALIQSSIREEHTPADRVIYSVIIEEKVVLNSYINVFNRTIPMTMMFEPEVIDNGDMVLHVDSFAIGDLQLPVDVILQMLSQTIELPEWVVVQPNNNTIYMAVTNMLPDEPYSIHVVSFNLEEEEFVFELHFPLE